MAGGTGQLLAIRELHISYAGNHAQVERMVPASDDDRLTEAVAVATSVADTSWTLKAPASACRRVVRAPGNHEPGTRWCEGVRLEEVSVGCPRHRRHRPDPPGIPRRVVPAKGRRR